MNHLGLQNDTAVLGLAAVGAGSAPVIDSMVHHLLDRRSVEDNSATHSLLVSGFGVALLALRYAMVFSAILSTLMPPSVVRVCNQTFVSQPNILAHSSREASGSGISTKFEVHAFAYLNLMLELGNDLVVENDVGSEGSLDLIDHSGGIIDVVGLQVRLEGINDCLYLVWLGVAWCG